MASLSFHFVTRDPARASQWYQAVLGAYETSRITLPDGDVLTIDLQLGDDQIAIADELPEHGIVSPLTLGGTYGALHLSVEDVDASWARALEAGAEVFEPLH
ncbi:MAG: VOC family protein, partial [Acidimicrobiales bacterium]